MMYEMRIIYMFHALLIVLLFINTVNPNSTTLATTGCVDLTDPSTYDGRVISSGMSVYSVVADVVLCTGNYELSQLIIDTDNVVFDGNDSVLTFTHNNSLMGQVNGLNITIQNTTFIAPSECISCYIKMRIENSTIRDNNFANAGLWILGDCDHALPNKGNLIYNNTFIGGGHALSIDSTLHQYENCAFENNIIFLNRFINSTMDEVYIDKAFNNHIVCNYFEDTRPLGRGTTDDALDLNYYTDNLTVEYNRFNISSEYSAPHGGFIQYEGTPGKHTEFKYNWVRYKNMCPLINAIEMSNVSFYKNIFLVEHGFLAVHNSEIMDTTFEENIICSVPSVTWLDPSVEFINNTCDNGAVYDCVRSCSELSPDDIKPYECPFSPPDSPDEDDIEISGTVRINPGYTTVRTTDDLYCVANVSHLVDDEVVFVWYRDGVFYSSETVICLDFGTEYQYCTSSLIPNSETTKHENWTCEVTVTASGFVSVLSDSRVIENTLPSVPDLIQPASGATLTQGIVHFDWTQSSDPDVLEGTDSIEYEFSINGAVSGMYSVVTDEYNYNLGPGVYSWKVRACDDEGCSAWSEEWTFNVEDSSSPVPLDVGKVLDADITPDPAYIDDSLTCKVRVNITNTNGAILHIRWRRAETQDPVGLAHDEWVDVPAYDEDIAVGYGVHDVTSSPLRPTDGFTKHDRWMCVPSLTVVMLDGGPWVEIQNRRPYKIESFLPDMTDYTCNDYKVVGWIHAGDPDNDEIIGYKVWLSLDSGTFNAVGMPRYSVFNFTDLAPGEYCYKVSAYDGESFSEPSSPQCFEVKDCRCPNIDHVVIQPVEPVVGDSVTCTAYIKDPRIRETSIVSKPVPTIQDIIDNNLQARDIGSAYISNPHSSPNTYEYRFVLQHNGVSETITITTNQLSANVTRVFDAPGELSCEVCVLCLNDFYGGETAQQYQGCSDASAEITLPDVPLPIDVSVDAIGGVESYPDTYDTLVCTADFGTAIDMSSVDAVQFEWYKDDVLFASEPVICNTHVCRWATVIADYQTDKFENWTCSARICKEITAGVSVCNASNASVVIQNIPPDAPILVYPQNSAVVHVSSSPDSVQFTVEGSDADDNTLNYEFWLYNSGSWTHIADAVGYDTVSIEHSLPVGSYSWKSRTYDGYEWSEWSEENPFVVVMVPEIDFVEIASVDGGVDPMRFETTDDLVCNAEIANADVAGMSGTEVGPLTAVFKWYRDGALVSTETMPCTDALCSSSPVMKTETAKHETWRCEVEACYEIEGIEYCDTGSDEVEIQNLLPDKPLLVYPPDSATVSADPLVLRVTDSYDYDGDLLTYRFILSDITGSATVLGESTISAFVTDLPPRGAYSWWVVVSDGEGEVESDHWTFTTFVNNPPSINGFVINPALPRTSSFMQCEATWVWDLDNDSVNVKFEIVNITDPDSPIVYNGGEFYLDSSDPANYQHDSLYYEVGDVVHAHDILSPLSAGPVRKGEKWKCIAYLNDSHTVTTVETASVTVVNTPPTKPDVWHEDPQNPVEKWELLHWTESTDIDNDALVYNVYARHLSVLPESFDLIATTTTTSYNLSFFLGGDYEWYVEVYDGEAVVSSDIDTFHYPRETAVVNTHWSPEHADTSDTLLCNVSFEPFRDYTTYSLNITAKKNGVALENLYVPVAVPYDEYYIEIDPADTEKGDTFLCKADLYSVSPDVYLGTGYADTVIADAPPRVLLRRPESGSTALPPVNLVAEVHDPDDDTVNVTFNVYAKVCMDDGVCIYPLVATENVMDVSEGEVVYDGFIPSYPAELYLWNVTAYDGVLTGESDTWTFIASPPCGITGAEIAPETTVTNNELVCNATGVTCLSPPCTVRFDVYNGTYQHTPSTGYAWALHHSSQEMIYSETTNAVVTHTFVPSEVGYYLCNITLECDSCPGEGCTVTSNIAEVDTGLAAHIYGVDYWFDYSSLVPKINISWKAWSSLDSPDIRYNISVHPATPGIPDASYLDMSSISDNGLLAPMRGTYALSIGIPFAEQTVRCKVVATDRSGAVASTSYEIALCYPLIEPQPAIAVDEDEKTIVCRAHPVDYCDEDGAGQVDMRVILLRKSYGGTTWIMDEEEQSVSVGPVPGNVILYATDPQMDLSQYYYECMAEVESHGVIRSASVSYPSPGLSRTTQLVDEDDNASDNINHEHSINAIEQEPDKRHETGQDTTPINPRSEPRVIPVRTTNRSEVMLVISSLGRTLEPPRNTQKTLKKH